MDHSNEQAKQSRARAVGARGCAVCALTASLRVARADVTRHEVAAVRGGDGRLLNGIVLLALTPVLA
eukprot:3267924-Prymnesium_polylepis.1